MTVVLTPIQETLRDTLNAYIDHVFEQHRLIYRWQDPDGEELFACYCDRANPLPRRAFNEHLKAALKT